MAWRRRSDANRAKRSGRGSRRWRRAKAGVRDEVFAAPIKDRGNRFLMLDGAIVRARQQAAAGKGGPRISLWGVAEADRPSKSTCPLTASAGRRASSRRRHADPLHRRGGEQGGPGFAGSVEARLGLSEEVADGIVFIASDEARFITGHVLSVDGGHSAN